MPRACVTVCAHVGCNTLVARPGLCAACQKLAYKEHGEARRQTDYDAVERHYHTARWQKLRAAVLRDEPLCRVCFGQDRITAAVLVDHIEPLKDAVDPQSSMWDRDNLQPLCDRCHQIKSGREAAARLAMGIVDGGPRPVARRSDG